MKRLLTHNHILLLQGKMGTFFCRFASFLMGQGKTVHKINFNAGDAFFYCHKDNMDNYRGKPEAFDEFLLSEAQIITKATYTIDGHCTDEYYTPEELQERVGGVGSTGK